MPSAFYEQHSEIVFFGPIRIYPLPKHVHDSVEIICLSAGELEMSVSGKKRTILPGDTAVIFPSVPHGYISVSPDADGMTLIFPPDAIAEFSGAFRVSMPANPVLDAASKPAELDHLIEMMTRLPQGNESPHKLGYLHLFLSYLFASLTLQPLARHMQSGLAHQVLHYISEHFTEPLTLETTAHALGISRTHLSHIFSQQLGINFREYINSLRIDRACQLLRDPFYSVSQIACLCGYGNPRTFHRAFLSKCSMPPNRFRSGLFGQKDAEDSDSPPDA